MTVNDKIDVTRVSTHQLMFSVHVVYTKGERIPAGLPLVSVNVDGGICSDHVYHH